MDQEAQYHSWIRAVYALEMHSDSLLQAFIHHLQPWPALQLHVLVHAEETQDNIANLERFMQHNNVSGSSTQNRSTPLFQPNIEGIDRLIMAPAPAQHFLGCYLLENYEIGCLTTVQSAAECMGDREGMHLLNGFIRQDLKMAGWALMHMPEMTSNLLASHPPPTTSRLH